jgi:hypothetical protein
MYVCIYIYRWMGRTKRMDGHYFSYIEIDSKEVIK